MKKLFAVSSSHLSCEAIASEVLPHYGLNQHAKCEFYSGGFNHTYRVTMEDGSVYFLRAYRKNWRTLDDIHFELDVLNHLHKKNFPAAHPLSTKEGSYFYPVNAPEGTRYIALFTLAPGSEISYKANPEQVARSYGQAVAKMHNTLDDFQSPYLRFQLDLDYFTRQPLKYIEPFLIDRPEDWNYIKHFASELRQRLLALPAAKLEMGFCHGDLQGYHANVSEEGNLTFYDFDCGGYGFRAFDLAVFLWCCRLEDAVTDRWDPFINAYRETRAIKELDIQAVPLFVCARYLWHIGVHTQNSTDWGVDFLNKDYFKDHLERLRKAEKDYLVE
ncbi:MAG: phosphotransferase [Anaerolineaceae bacterium]|nr:phosphotransferase [Anaerolineaceae bacterium]